MKIYEKEGVAKNSKHFAVLKIKVPCEQRYIHTGNPSILNQFGLFSLAKICLCVFIAVRAANVSA